MRLIFITLFIFSSIIFANTPIDAKKFSGLWYEIARIENSFQSSCVASSVEYKLQDDYSYDVFNRCFENELNGKLIEYNGFAKLKNNQLFMRYFYIFTSSYNIEYLNNYQTAVVANDDHSNLWIMSRTANIDKDELNKILEDLKNKMDTSKLIFTKLDPKGRYK
ncbi:lipocalin family protein [bacterium]|nr:lipocalin family protein [bacterium]